ncbi:MAG: TRAP transporter small permease [Pigmentiphaga sp.]
MKPLLLLFQAALKRMAEVCIAVLALLTLADVVGRYFLNSSIVGAVELTEIFMVGVIFCGIVLSTAAREHVAVDLLPLPFGRLGARIFHAASQLIAAAICIVLGAASWSQAKSALDYADQTTMLNLPLAPVVFFMSIMLFINTAVQLSLTWIDLRNEVRRHV